MKVPQRIRFFRSASVVAASLSLLLSGCSSNHSSQIDPEASAFGTIKISRGISTETDTIAHIYAMALEQAGYSVELVDTGDTRQDYLDAMGGLEESAEPTESTSTDTASATADPATVDLTPDYSGNLLYQLTDDGAFSTSYIEQQRQRSASANSSAENEQEDDAAEHSGTNSLPPVSPSPQQTSLQASSMSSADILDSIDRLLPERLSLLAASDGQNRDALVVTQATAAKYELNTIEDLAQHCSQLTFGEPSQFTDKPYGLATLKQSYKCTPHKIEEYNDQRKLSEALATDTVQVANIYSASSLITQNSYKVLDDPHAIFIPQQIVPVIRVDEMPASAREAVENVSRQISTDDLKNFDRLTHGTEAMSSKDVATFWWEHSKE